MSEELQSLLDRIQRDGVDRAEKKAAELVAEAGKKAAAIVAGAEKTAAETRARAERDAKAFAENSEKSLKQSARDVILSVGEAVARAMDGIVAESVNKALTPEVLKELLVKVVELYAQKGPGEGTVEIRMNPRDREQMQNFFMARFSKAMENGLRIEPDGGIAGGFEVRVKGGNVSHDFSSKAIAEVLCGMMRPRLAAIVSGALKDEKTGR